MPVLARAREGLSTAARALRALRIAQTDQCHPTIDGVLPVRWGAPVDVVRDRFGVPHVFAEDERSAFFGLGFVQAQDRLFQVDGLRRLAAGRVAELAGPTALPIDRLMRRLGFADIAGRDLAAASAEERSLLFAYAEGFNDGVRSLPALPPEYAVLGAAPEPWHPEHSLLVGRFALFSFSGNWPSELLRERLLHTLGPDRAAALEPTYVPAHAEGDIPGPVRERLLDAYLAAAERGMPAGGGSNAWAIAGARTASGKPLLASDPHLQPRLPGLFHVAHLHGGAFDAIGATIPGVPAVVIGHNGRVAWGLTAGLSDSSDCYIETLDPQHRARYRVPDGWATGRIRVERIAVRGRETVEERVLETRHGPIIGPALPGEARALALRATALEPGASVGTLLDLARARNVEEADATLHHWPGAPFNFVLADADGAIGFRHAGQVPVRQPGEGLLPGAGATSPGPPPPVPAGSMPAFRGPPPDLVISANEAPESDLALGADWAERWRVERIRSLLDARGEHTVASQFPIQCDTYSGPMVRLRDALLEAGAITDDEARECAARWNGRMDAQSAGAALLGATFHEAVTGMATRLAGPAAPALLGEAVALFVRGMIYTRLAGWLLEQLRSLEPEERARFLRASSERAVALLRGRFGGGPERWRWGSVHAVTYGHAFHDAPVLGPAWSRGPYAAPGDVNTPWQGGFSPFDGLGAVGDQPAYRQVIDLGAIDRSVFQLPTGNVGIPGHPRYDDCLPEFFSGRYRPLLFTRGAVEAAAEHRLRLEPAASVDGSGR